MVLAAGAVLAGCTSSTSGSGSGSAASSTAASSTAAASSSSSAAGSTTAGPTSAASSASNAAAACTGAQIKVTSTPPPGGAAAGHVGLVLLFQNSSTTTCVLSGYPGVDGLNSSGQSIAHASRTLNGMIGFCGCTAPATLTLGPGVVVSAVVEGTSAGSGPANCAPFPSLLVTPPNTTVSTPIAASPESCDFTVHPVVTGLAGQSGTP